MSIKIYDKQGRRGYKENKMIKDLEPIIEKMMRENPDSKFTPAKTIEELKALHSQYTAEETNYTEINNSEMAKKTTEVEFEEPETTKKQNDFDFEDTNDFIDPFNREEPTTYDYTNEAGMAKDVVNPTNQQNFDEPMSFDEAFELPEDNENEEPERSAQKQKQSGATPPPKQKRERQEPLNASFDEMSTSKKKKNTKKFAKYIVEAVCSLLERGFIWYANKDINEAKLTEYEMSGEIDLSLLVTLSNGQEVTVKQFFQQQCMLAEELAKFKDEHKQDLTDSLAEVFMEKGIAPTTTQEAIMVAIAIAVEKGAILLSLKANSNAILEQLKLRNAPADDYQTPPPAPQYQPAPEPTEEAPAPLNEINELPIAEDVLEIEQVIETKE